MISPPQPPRFQFLAPVQRRNRALPALPFLFRLLRFSCPRILIIHHNRTTNIIIFNSSCAVFANSYSNISSQTCFLSHTERFTFAFRWSTSICLAARIATRPRPVRYEIDGLTTTHRLPTIYLSNQISSANILLFFCFSTTIASLRIAFIFDHQCPRQLIPDVAHSSELTAL